MSTVTTTLKKAHQLTVSASPNRTTAILNPLTIFNSYIAEGDSITISATPNSGYDFKGWSANGITLADKTDNPLTISMATNDVTLTPVFVISATGITLDKTTLSLLPNLSESITATVQPTNAADKSVTWSSSDTNIATVDAAGVVTGKNVGTATITVTTTDGGYSASCTVTVTAAYTVTPSTLTFTGSTSDLTFKVNEPAMTELQSVTVDGVTLATSNYTVTSGSTVITLKNSWLTAQPNGTYAIITNFANGKAGVTLTVDQSSTSSGSSSASTGNTGGSGRSTGGTNTSKDFWYPNSSGTTNTASGKTSANSGSATSPDSPKYNPVTGGEVGGAGSLIGFSTLAIFSSVGIYLKKRKR